MTTRLVILRSPAERITISIYGYAGDEQEQVGHIEAPRVTEDWTWLSSWAGGVPSLLNLLNDDTQPTTLHRALQSLDLLADIHPILAQLIDHPIALPHLLSLPSYPPQPLLQRLLADPTFALHANLRHYLPPGHPLRPLAQFDRKVAWERLDLGRGALMVLAAGDEDDLLDVPSGGERTGLASLLERAESWAGADDEESKRCLGLALDILNRPSSDLIVTSHLALRLPPLAVIAHTRGVLRDLNLPPIHSRQIVKSLLEASTDIINGQPSFPAALHLATPYLPHFDPTDPLRTAFTSPRIALTPRTPLLDTPDGRRLLRLSNATSDPNTDLAPTSMHHAATPSELLSILAPSLLRALSTAPIPPLGIPPAVNDTPESQADAWAGKVYSEHEFRLRENVGLGIAVGGRGARPASRHVDEYA